MLQDGLMSMSDDGIPLQNDDGTWLVSIESKARVTTNGQLGAVLYSWFDGSSNLLSRNMALYTPALCDTCCCFCVFNLSCPSTNMRRPSLWAAGEMTSEQHAFGKRRRGRCKIGVFSTNSSVGNAEVQQRRSHAKHVQCSQLHAVLNPPPPAFPFHLPFYISARSPTNEARNTR